MIQKNSGAVAIQSPYLRVVGMEVDADGNDRGQRAFTEQEEMEFLQMARKENFYEDFTRSIAPQIYGHPGICDYLTSETSKKLLRVFCLAVQKRSCLMV